VVGGETTNEEGFLLQRIVREGLASHDIDSRAGGGPSPALQRALAAPAAQATIPDLEAALGVAAGEARRDEVGRLAEAASAEAGAVHALADLLSDAGEDVVIL